MKLAAKIAALALAVAFWTACPPGHGVVLSWQSGGGYSQAAYYKVYRSQDGAAAAVVASVGQQTPTWTDSTVASGHAYAYWVTAYDPLVDPQESRPSNTFAVTIP